MVRAWTELDNPELTYKPKLLIGARLVFIDGTPDILVYPRDRAAYGRLCQLLTRGKLGTISRDREGRMPAEARRPPGICRRPAAGADAAASVRGGEASQKFWSDCSDSRADGVWLAASLLYRGDDKRRLARLHRCRRDGQVPLLATNDVLYHHPERRPLQDVLTCIREKTTIEAIGRRLEANAERHLKPAQKWRGCSAIIREAIAETMRFAARIRFSLAQLKYQYPDEPVPPGKTAQQHLEDLTWAGVDKYFRRQSTTSCAPP